MEAQRNESSILADALIGAAAGAAAVWVMDRVDWFNFLHEDPAARRRTMAVRPGGMSPDRVAATRTARALGHDLTHEERKRAGLAVHYSLGVLPGALYAGVRRKAPVITTGAGTAFGLGLFFLQDEGLNAISDLSARPDDYPWQAHARGFVAHAVYGLVLDTILSLSDTLRGR